MQRRGVRGKGPGRPHVEPGKPAAGRPGAAETRRAGASDADVSSDANIALVAGILRRLGLPEMLASPILGHAAMVASEADRLGLVAPGDRGVIVPRHSADSLLFALARVPRPDERWADVGSGAGFPGIPLACCYPMTRFVLYESRKRKAGFLELAAVSLGLDNVEVRGERFVPGTEDAPPGRSGRRRPEGPVTEERGSDTFDVCVARALRDPAEAIPLLASRLKVDGTAIVAVGFRTATPPGAEALNVVHEGVASPSRLIMLVRQGSTGSQVSRES